MSGLSTSDFASLLDELIAEKEREAASASRPSMPFGFVAPDDAVEALWANVPGDVAADLYRTAEFADLGRKAPGIETPEPPLPPVEPAAIAEELRIAYARWPRDFDRIRREFALANHPDRVEPAMRERALARMQIANMLIDEAKRKLAAQ